MTDLPFQGITLGETERLRGAFADRGIKVTDDDHIGGGFEGPCPLCSPTGDDHYVFVDPADEGTLSVQCESGCDPREILLNVGMGGLARHLSGAAGSPQPIPLDDIERPAFPADALPDVLRDYALAVADETQTPVALAGMFTLAAVSALLARQAEIEHPWREALNLYVLPVAGVSERKSPVVSKTSAPLEEIESERRKRIGPERDRLIVRREAARARLEHFKRLAAKATGADRQVALAEVDQASQELREAAAAVPPRPDLQTEDATPEALTSLLYECGGRMAVFTDEGGEVFELMSRYAKGAPNLGVYLRGYDGSRPLRVNRASGGERGSLYVERPALTLAMSVQPGVLEAIGGSKAMGDRGLTQRFLFACPEGTRSRALNPPRVPEHVSEAYADLLRRVSHVEDGLRLRLSAEAEALFTEYRRGHEAMRDELPDSTFRGWWGKLPGNLMRVAAIFHVVENGVTEKVITADAMRRALDMADYFSAHARYALDKVSPEPEMKIAQRILLWIEDRNEDVTEVERRDLQRALNVPVVDLIPALRLLCRHRYLRRLPAQSGAKGGRPPIAYAVNPGFVSSVGLSEVS